MSPGVRGIQLLYWVSMASVMLSGVLVVLPFYAYGIPANGAGDVQVYDVKQYWPFGFEGRGAVLHDAGIVLALLAPVMIPMTIVWCVRKFLGSAHRRLVTLLPALLSLWIGLAYLMNWRAILGWHLD